ncbi:MAG: hypothetical protein ACI8P3_002592, partial [Saprospiraceae bacterium]
KCDKANNDLNDDLHGLDILNLVRK